MEISTESRITASQIRGPEPAPANSVERAKLAGKYLHKNNSDSTQYYASAAALMGILELLEERLPAPVFEKIPEYGTAAVSVPEAVPYGPDELNLNFRVKTPKALHTSEVFKIIKDMLPCGYEVKTMDHRLQEYSNKENNYVYVSAIAVRLTPVPYGAVDA